MANHSWENLLVVILHWPVAAKLRVTVTALSNQRKGEKVVVVLLQGGACYSLVCPSGTLRRSLDRLIINGYSVMLSKGFTYCEEHPRGVNCGH